MDRVAARSACTIFAVMCCACATSSKVVTAEKAETALTFIKANDDDMGLNQLYELADTDNLNPTDEAEYVRKLCGIKDPGPHVELAEVGGGAGVIGVFVGGLMKLFVGEIGDSLERRIKEYSAAYSGSEVIDFYSRDQRGHEANLQTPYRCFRFVRSLPSSGEKRQLAVDFVGMIRISDDQTGLDIKPLRLYVSQMIAKTSKKADGKYGFAVGIIARSSWRQGNKGRAGEVFNEVLAAEEIQVLPGHPYLKYFEKPEDEKGKKKPAGLKLRAPIIPYSVGSRALSAERGRAAFEVRVAETGTPPDGLLFFSKLFAKSSEELATLLAASINVRLGFAKED